MSGHRKRIKHYHEAGDLHEFTFSCYQRHHARRTFRAEFLTLLRKHGVDFDEQYLWE